MPSPYILGAPYTPHSDTPVKEVSKSRGMSGTCLTAQWIRAQEERAQADYQSILTYATSNDPGVLERAPAGGPIGVSNAVTNAAVQSDIEYTPQTLMSKTTPTMPEHHLAGTLIDQSRGQHKPMMTPHLLAGAEAAGWHRDF